MSNTISKKRQIKGGGRAVMSRESQEALLDLLMRLDDYKNTESSKELSEHDRKRKEKNFVRRLVQEHEQQHWKRKLNATKKKTKHNRERSKSPVPSTTTITAPRPLSSNNTNEKVRIELVEAIFKDPKKEKKKDKDKKETKKSSSKEKKTAAAAIDFKEGTKKVLVLPRSTTNSDLLKQAVSKLRVKKPVRAFLKVSKSTLVNLEGDLSGIDDGTTIYVTSSLPRVDRKKDAVVDDKETCNDNNAVADAIDYLESVKMAYWRQDQSRRERHRLRMARTRERSAIVNTAKLAKHAEIRASLPAASFKNQILESVQNHKVVVLCGATGCGKSTQVPQFLLEEQESSSTAGAASKPKYIVVTQPRRVAAISLANRVAEERGSPPPGDPGSSVGYLVRSDRKIDESTCRIVYVTVGILLRMLVSEANANASSGSDEASLSLSIENISHLVIDEVHERDVNTDFTLTLLKGLMFSAQSRLAHLRLILMSATASSDLFVNYFTTKKPNAKPPVVLEIPGRTFPVDIKWLRDCEGFAGAKMWRSNASHTNEDNSSNASILSPRAKDKIDNNFIRALISKIVQQQQSEGQLNATSGQYRSTGAILVFLPGRGEIESLASCLHDPSTVVGDKTACSILKLHSGVTRSEQDRVFRPAVEGTVKIVLATNIAETSVTISDVSHVIDTCVVKESRYNASSRIRELVTVWTSKASLSQRSGRAGRTSAGVCWRLCTEDFCQQTLLPQTAPEMLRTPLDELVLQICLLYEQRRDTFYMNSIGDPPKMFAPGAQPIKFLSMTPAPPPKNSLVQACRHLLEVDALRVVKRDGDDDDGEKEDSWSYRLTPLGYHLSRLPMDAKVGKVLIVGCILGCLDGALTVAAALSCTKSCFYSMVSDPVAKQARDHLIVNGFGGANWPGGTVKGDLIAVIAAYRAWEKHKSDSQKWKFCKHHALDQTTLRDMDRLRNQFRDLLADVGFVTTNHGGFDDCNTASEDALLISCCLVAGLYPNIGSLIRPRKGGPRGGRLYTNDGDECRPESNSFQRKRIQEASETGRDAYAVYHSKHRSVGTVKAGSKNNQRPPEVFLTQVNFVSRFALLLFGGDLEIESNAIIVDGWLKFKVSIDFNSSSSKNKKDAVDNAVLILALRRLLDQMILEHIVSESSSVSDAEQMKERHQNAIQVVRKLLSDEG